MNISAKLLELKIDHRFIVQLNDCPYRSHFAPLGFCSNPIYKHECNTVKFSKITH